jgi:hypothetical protein
MLTPALNTRHSLLVKPIALPSSLDSDTMETEICAQELAPSSLKTNPISDICQDNVDGLCPRPDLCDGDHRICHIKQDSTKPKVAAAKNCLHLSPRPKSDSFEDDGPGNLSRNGARHDNDYLRIKDIQILPTTDEILSLRLPYVPFKDPEARHFLAKGFTRHVDCLFRQLRADSSSPQELLFLSHSTRDRRRQMATYTPCSGMYDSKGFFPMRRKASWFVLVSLVRPS